MAIERTPRNPAMLIRRLQELKEERVKRNKAILRHERELQRVEETEVRYAKALEALKANPAEYQRAAAEAATSLADRIRELEGMKAQLELSSRIDATQSGNHSPTLGQETEDEDEDEDLDRLTA